MYIGVVGNINAAKSASIAALAKDRLDLDGHSRDLVARHPHEIKSGKTSDINTIPLFTSIPGKDHYVVNLIDLAGHQHLMPQVIQGLLTYRPQFCLVMISVNDGIQKMTRHHLALLHSFGIPIIIVITKIDLADSQGELLTTTICQLRDLLKKISIKFVYQVKEANCRSVVTNYLTNPSMIAPIFTLSNKTGAGLSLLKQFLFELAELSQLHAQTDLLSHASLPLPTVLEINDKITGHNVELNHLFIVYRPYLVDGIGWVLHGCNQIGTIRTGDVLHLGPFNTYQTKQNNNSNSNNRYIRVRVRSIEYDDRTPTDVLEAGAIGCLGIKAIDPSSNLSASSLVQRKLARGKVCLDLPFAAQQIIVYGRIPTQQSLADGCQGTLHVGNCQILSTIVFATQESSEINNIVNQTQNRSLPSSTSEDSMSSGSSSSAVPSVSEAEILESLEQNQGPKLEQFRKPILLGQRGYFIIQPLYPQFIYPGQNMCLRDGSIKLIGSVQHVTSGKFIDYHHRSKKNAQQWQ